MTACLSALLLVGCAIRGVPHEQNVDDRAH